MAAIPQVAYVIDQQGKKMVQINVDDWENFVQEFRRVQDLLVLKNKLKNAFREVRQIQKGEKEGITLEAFLHEL